MRADDVVAHVAAFYGLNPVRLTGDERWSELRIPRLTLWATLRLAGYSWPAIGRATNRDPRTVAKGVRNERTDWARAQRFLKELSR